LDDPVHLFPFQQRLGEADRWADSRRGRQRFDDSAFDDLRRDPCHFNLIAGSTCIVQSEKISWVQAEAIAKMMEEITGYADRGGSDRVRANKERRHCEVSGR